MLYTRSSVRLVLAVLAAVLAATPVAAQVQQRSYDIRHNFWILPWNPTVLGQVVWRDFEHAWAAQPGFPTAVQVSTVPQNPGFNGLGFDFMDPRGQVWNTGTGGLVRVNETTTAYVGPPWPFVASSSVNAVSGGNSAAANASVSINQWVAGGPLRGSTRAWGNASVGAGGGSAYAYSEGKTALRALTVNWRTGRFIWTPWFVDQIQGSASAWQFLQRPWPRDPINVRMLDDAENVLLDETLVDIKGGINQGENASISWQTGRLAMANVMEGDFHVYMDSPYIAAADRGIAELKIENGIITHSNATGIFAGLLPPVGMPGTFDIPFLYELDFDYALPALGSSTSQMEFEFGGGPDCPEPATMSLLALGGLALIRRRKP